MIDIVPFERLGQADLGWLETHYHFSFADYHDPARMGRGPLRVWNDDRVRPGGGFPMHPHRDFEIITYVRKGAVTHQDSMGNTGRTADGDVQVMSAGTGIVHAEYNLENEDLELFQIWVRPARIGLTPRWETRHFTKEQRRGRLMALASGRPGVEAALAIHQDVVLLAGELAGGETVSHRLDGGRQAYLVPAGGAVEVNGVAAPSRAGIAVSGEDALTIRAVADAEVVLLDLP